MDVVTIRLTDRQVDSYLRDELLRRRIQRSCERHATEPVTIQVVGRGLMHRYDVTPHKEKRRCPR